MLCQVGRGSLPFLSFTASLMDLELAQIDKGCVAFLLRCPAIKTVGNYILGNS